MLKELITKFSQSNISVNKISEMLHCKIVGLEGGDVYAGTGTPVSELKLFKVEGSNHYNFGLEKSIGDEYKRLWEQEVNERLSQFVEDFTFTYEALLSGYSERLDKQISKSGKYAGFFNKGIDTLAGGVELTEGVAKAGLSVMLKVLGAIANGVGSYNNREELKKLTEHLYIFKKDQGKARNELVKAGLNIFRSFESQFVQVTSIDESKSWQRAMTKLAHDASNRVISYYRENREKEFAASSITEGVILGKSKEYKHTSTDIPHLLDRGHSLLDKNFEPWNTAELFEEVGLVIDPNGKRNNYNRYNTESPVGEKYGFRLLFEWEKFTIDGKWLAVNNKKYTLITPKYRRYDYLLTHLTEGELKDKQKVILDKIYSEDPNLMEKRLSDTFKEVIDDVKETLNELEKHIEETLNELKTYISNNHKELLECIETNHEELLEYMKTNHKEMQDVKEAVDEIKQKLEELKGTAERTEGKVDRLIGKELIDTVDGLARSKINNKAKIIEFRPAEIEKFKSCIGDNENKRIINIIADKDSSLLTIVKANQALPYSDTGYKFMELDRILTTENKIKNNLIMAFKIKEILVNKLVIDCTESNINKENMKSVYIELSGIVSEQLKQIILITKEGDTLADLSGVAQEQDKISFNDLTTDTKSHK